MSETPRYSLRAFARMLDTDHATLSQILRSRRRLTSRVIATLGQKLRLTTAEIALYCALENDAALLGLIVRPSFRADSRWIATQLGIPIDDVNVSLQRLLHSGTIVMCARDQWRIR